MNIEIGQTYRTRDGGYAIVESEHMEEPVYRFSGKCFDKDGNYDRLAYWTPDGRYSSVHQTPFDLSEVADVPLHGLTADALSQCRISFWSGSDLLAHAPLPAGEAPIDEARAGLLSDMALSDDPDTRQRRSLIESGKCAVRLHAGEHSVRVDIGGDERRSGAGHENFVVVREALDVPGDAPAGIDLIRIDEFVAPLTSEQGGVIRAIVGRYELKPEAFVYETTHGHIVQFKRADSEYGRQRTQRDEVEFYLAMVRQLRWVSVRDDEIKIGLVTRDMAPDYFLIDEDDAAPRP